MIVLNKAKGHTYLQLKITTPVGRLQVNIGQKIDHRYWDPYKKRLRITAKNGEDHQINELLDAIERRVAALLAKSKIEGYSITRGDLQGCVTGIDTSNTLFKKWEHDIRHKQVSEARRKVYISKLHMVKRYTSDIPISQVDAAWLKKFLLWLKGNNYASETIKTTLAVVKSVTGLHHTGVSVRAESATKVVLSMEEIKRIYELPLHQKYLEDAKKRFVMECLTGLRYADLMTVQKEHVSQGVITIRTSKTGERVSIPMHPYVVRIMEDPLPMSISNQKYNAFIKLLCQIALIDDEVVINYNKGGVQLTRVAPKWQEVSSHTARRSFATNAYLAGIPAEQIMMITGHKNHKTFMLYIKISSHKNALVLKDHPFFK